MSDDLIKRLGDPNRDWPEFRHDRREAKDRIEQLEREVRKLREQPHHKPEQRPQEVTS